MDPRNEHNDVVFIELDRPRQIRFGHLALKRFCALSGATMSRIMDVVDDYDNFILLLWCALSADDPSLTRERLDELLDALPRVSDIIEPVTAALVVSFGGEEDAAEADPPTAAGTGARA